MVDASAVNYIKQQLHAGYTEQEIRQAMLEAGWSEQDIRDAFYVIYGDSKPVKPQKSPEEPRLGYYQGEEEPGEAKEYISPWETSGREEHEFHKPPWEEKKPEQPEEKKPEKHMEEKKPETGVVVEPGFRAGGILSIIGGALILANFAMNFLGYGDLLGYIYGEFILLSSLNQDLVQIIVLAAGGGSLTLGLLLKMKPQLDLYSGIAVSLLGLSAFLAGNGYMFGGLACIAAGSLSIVRK